jgi:hypothetical protein
MIMLHRQFDDRKFARSQGDVSHVYKGAVPELKDVPDGNAKIAMDGVIWFQDQINGTLALRGDDAYALFADERYHRFVIWMGNAITTKTQELRRKGVQAAAFAAFPRHPSEAMEFFGLVGRGGDGTEEKGHPAITLHNWLRGLKGRNKPHGFKIGHIYMGAIAAWNAYAQGRSLERIAIDKRGSPGLLEVE